MNARLPFVVSVVVAMTSIVFWAGCGRPDQTGDSSQAARPTEPAGDHGHDHAGEDAHDHDAAVDPHDVPITDEQKEQLRKETEKFADAVAKVKELRDTVERETRDGIPKNPFEAHQALDKADIIVQWLPKIARDSGVAKEHWETVNTAANELREAFDKVHLNIDAKVDPGFTAVKQSMDARLAELQAIAQ